jgi:ribosomal protein S27E
MNATTTIPLPCPTCNGEQVFHPFGDLSEIAPCPTCAPCYLDPEGCAGRLLQAIVELEEDMARLKDELLSCPGFVDAEADYESGGVEYRDQYDDVDDNAAALATGEG